MSFRAVSPCRSGRRDNSGCALNGLTGPSPRRRRWYRRHRRRRAGFSDRRRRARRCRQSALSRPSGWRACGKARRCPRRYPENTAPSRREKTTGRRSLYRLRRESGAFCRWRIRRRRARPFPFRRGRRRPQPMRRNRDLRRGSPGKACAQAKMLHGHAGCEPPALLGKRARRGGARHGGARQAARRARHPARARPRRADESR